MTGDPGLVTGLATVDEPEDLRRSVRARVLDQPEAWGELAGDGAWLADRLWPAWAGDLEARGVTRVDVARVVAGYHRELWLWLMGERTWAHILSSIAGRLERRSRPER